MLNIIQNTIGAIRRVGESVVRAGLKMWLPFTTADHLGREVVSDNSFNDTNEWIKESGWTVSNGLATRTNVGTYSALQQHCLVSGTTYQVTIVIDSITSGELFGVRLGTNYIIRDKSSANTYQGIAVANSTLLSIMGEPNFAGTISSISIKEATQISTDISGNDNNAILKTGKALVFSGNDSVETSFSSSKTIKTIAFWIYPTHSASFETLFNLGITNIPVYPLGDRVIQLNHLTISNKANYPLNFDVYIDGVYRGETTYNGDNPTLSLNQWQRVVFVNSSGTSTLNDTFDIAYTGSGSHGRFKMSDLQIYGAEFTTDDIAYDYANPQKLVTDNASSNVTLNDLHAWWHMSEGDGTIAFDSAPLIGKELVTNGDFATDSDWVTEIGWSISDGKAIALNVPNTERLQQSISGYTPVVGNTYRYSFDISNVNGFYTVWAFGTTILNSVNTQGFVTGTFIATSTNVGFYIAGATSSGLISATIDNVSIKEVYNIDGETYDGSSLGATYDDAQERIPQLGMMNWSKGSNLIEYSEDFSEWTQYGSPTIVQNIISPDGILTGTQLTRGSNSTPLRFRNITTLNQEYTFSVYAKKGSADIMRLDIGDEAYTTFTLTDEWQRFAVTSTPTTYNHVDIGFVGSEIGDIYIWGAQLEKGTTASAYRRTNGTAVTDATLISCATDSQKDILGNVVRVKGSGFNLDGTGYGEVLDDNVFDVGVNEAFSICGWAKWKYVLQNSSTLNVIFSNGLTATGINSFSISARLEAGNNISNAFIGGTALNGSTTYTQGEWFYFALTREVTTGSCKLYTSRIDSNGQWVVALDGTATNTNSLTNSGNKTIGWDGTTNDRRYHERIDDIKFYDRELSLTEIQQNFNATKSGHNN